MEVRLQSKINIILFIESLHNLRGNEKYAIYVTEKHPELLKAKPVKLGISHDIYREKNEIGLTRYSFKNSVVYGLQRLASMGRERDKGGRFQTG